jgi:hypothetical protein
MKRITLVVISLLLLATTQLHASQPENPAYEFMTQGWGGEAIQGYTSTRDVNGFFHRVGKVTNESVRLIKRQDNPSVNDEFYTFQYDGMTVSVYLAHFINEDRVMVVDVIITSPSWQVKQGLGIGTTRNKIESLFGKSMGASSDREWTYGDGLNDITYTFDKNNKAISIHWHTMLD